MEHLVRVTVTTHDPDRALRIQAWILRHYPVKECKVEQFNGKYWKPVNPFEYPERTA